MLRSHAWHDLDWSQTLLFWYGDNPAEDYPHYDTGPAWGPPWLAQATSRTLRLSRFSRPKDILNFIRDKDIEYLSTRPLSAQSLALEAMERDGHGSPLRAIIGFSTGVSDDQRDDCRRGLGARLISSYASKEGQNMAFECRAGTHLHVNEEMVLVEILDDEGEPCAAGQVGRVVVTVLFNFAQPIIRYDHGDLAIPGPRCQCGRTLNVIERVVGRQMQMFRFPDGTKISPMTTKSMSTALGARYLQLAQVGPLEIEVRYVPIEGQRRDEHAVTALVRRVTHPDAHVRFRAQPDLVRTDGGKFIETVCELR